MLYFIDIVIVDSIDSDCSILVAFFFFFCMENRVVG